MTFLLGSPLILTVTGRPDASTTASEHVASKPIPRTEEGSMREQATTSYDWMEAFGDT